MSNVSMINGHIDEPKRVSDNEIIEAMKYCCGNKGAIECTESTCYQAALPENRDGNTRWCRQWLMKDALDLINRLKADKEALIAGQETLMKCIAKKKETIAELDIQLENSEAFNKKLMQDLHSYHDFNIDRIKRVKDIAFKEFAERLKKEATIDEDSTWWISNIDVDNLVKEMTESGCEYKEIENLIK
jgi:hypothetical protein